MKGKADDQLAYPQASSKGWSPESGLRDRPKSTRLAQPLKAIIFATLDRDLSGLLNQTELLTVLTTSRCDVDAPPESAVDPGRQVSEYGYKMRNEGCLPWRVSNARAEIPDIDMDSSRSIDFVEFSLAMDNMDDERFLPEVRRHGFFDCNSVHIGTLFSNLPQQVGREWCAHFWRVLTDPTTACAACDMTNAGGVYNTGVTNGGCRMCIIHAQTLKFWHAQFLSAQVASRGHSSVSSVSLSDADPSSAPSSSLLTFFFSAATSISTTARDAVISAAACLASVVARLHDIIVFGLFGPYGRLLSFLGLVMLLMLLGIALVFRRALIGRRVSTTPSPESLAVVAGGEVADESAAGDSEECVVCFDPQATHATLPCGHFSLCSSCASAIVASGQCPVCRQPIVGTLRIYGAGHRRPATTPERKPPPPLTGVGLIGAALGLGGIAIPGMVMAGGQRLKYGDGLANVHITSVAAVPAAYVAHSFLVPLDCDSKEPPLILILAYCVQSLAWVFQICVALERLVLEHGLPRSNEEICFERLDTTRAVLIGLGTLLHGYLLSSQRIKPWAALRNVAAWAGLATGLCMLVSVVARPHQRLWTPNNVPLDVQCLRMLLSGLVSIASTKRCRCFISRALRASTTNGT